MIRPATSQDIAAIFNLMLIIWEDMEFEPWAVLEPKCFTEYMMFHMKQSHTKYSYQNVWVFEDEKHEILGILLGYDGQKEPAYDLDLIQTFKQEPLLQNMRLNRESRDDEWYLDSIVVSQAARGQGIGKQFFDYLPDIVPNNTVVGLNCDLNNHQAKRLYTRLGFKKIDEVQFSGHTYEHLQKTIKK